MKINVYGLADEKEYDERNLVKCKCGKHYYPSKKMFVEFLKQFNDVKANVSIWTHTDLDTGKVIINVQLKYNIHKGKI